MNTCPYCNQTKHKTRPVTKINKDFLVKGMNNATGIFLPPCLIGKRVRVEIIEE